MTYRKICTYCGNEILERLTEAEQWELDRKRRNRKKKQEREEIIGAWVGSFFGVLFCIGMLLYYFCIGY